MKKRYFIAVLLLVLLLAGCSGGEESPYKNDVAVSDLAAAVDASLSNPDLIAMQDSYLTNAMQLDPAAFAEYAVKINSKGINIDEYGIFKAPDAKSVEDTQEAAEGYLQFRLDTWMSEYMPEELPKLEEAQVKVCGEYVMYAILSDEDAEDAFAAFESALAK